MNLYERVTLFWSNFRQNLIVAVNAVAQTFARNVTNNLL